MFMLYFSCTWNVIFISKYAQLNNMSILYICLIFLDYPYELQFLACLKILSEVLQMFLVCEMIL